MTAWGTAPLENEYAADFIEEVIEDGPYALREAFEVALDPETEYLEAEEGHRAIAAAEIVLAGLSRKMGRLPENLQTWLQDTDQEELAELRDLATEALERVAGKDSELPTLWEDDDLSGWQAQLERLQAGLSDA